MLRRSCGTEPAVTTVSERVIAVPKDSFWLMAETSFVGEGPSWAVMLPEALANIFNRLSLEEKLLLIPRVCRAWRTISQDFVCWQIIDLDQWSSGRSVSTIDRMIKMLVKRSQGSLREFSSQYVGSDATFEFIAKSCTSLQLLRIPYSGVTDDGVRQIAPRLMCLTDLDISGCSALSKVALQTFGEHCRSIIRLCRNTYHQISSTSPSNEEALAIAQYFPQLKHLELSFALLSEEGLKAVLDNCVSLEYLDLRGCRYLEMDEAFIKECKKRLKVFYEPEVKNDVLDDGELDCLDYWDLSASYSEEAWDSDVGFYDMDTQEYEAEINGSFFLWPDTSP